MEYRRFGKSGPNVSVIGLGGHEYLADGRSRGFNEDFAAAVTPGRILPGFGSIQRRSLVEDALEHGINLFDVTIDSEKEALGRNLRELGRHGSVFIQTRPEGFLYTYDIANRRLLHYQDLIREVRRICDLIGVESLGFLNVGIMSEALSSDAGYLQKLSDNVRALKEAGLVDWVSADTFSGGKVYLKLIAQGCFDGVYINFNFADDGPAKEVFHAARESGMGIITREAFLKGALFEMAEEARIDDQSSLVQAALKWCLAHAEVSSVVVGARSVSDLRDSVAFLKSPVLDDDDGELLKRLSETERYGAYRSSVVGLY